MSTFLYLIVQLLADMGVPGMRQLESHLDEAPGHHTSERVGPAHGGMVHARAAETAEYQKRPKDFDFTPEISTGV